MSLTKFYLLDLKGVATTHLLPIEECHIYEDYETAEDEVKIVFINHPLLSGVQKLQNTTLQQIIDKLKIE